MSAGGKRRSFYTDLDHMQSLFDSVDTGRTGYIGFKELCILVRNIPGIEEAAVPELMDRLDRDRDGKVSFDDFEVLFAQEREEIKKKRKLNPNTGLSLTDLDISPYHHLESGSGQDQFLTAEHLPSIQEIPVSPAQTTPLRYSLRGEDNDRSIPEQSNVILRQKVTRRATLPARLDEPEYLSPIHAERQRRPPSNELPDLATQMRYLTDVTASPQLKRNSKVLSWISESEDMFDLEGAGQLYTSTRETESDGLPSPPLSPAKGGDEASNFKAILESVCHTDKIGKEAIRLLCKHVKADPQEESELLTLLSHLDKDMVGYVSLDDFVRGLQFIRNAAVVTSTPPSKTTSLRRTHSELIPPPYFGTPISSHPPQAFLASTPLPAGTAYTTDTSGLLTVLDPDHSGIVRVDHLISQWQQLGVEGSHDTSLEDALNEVVTIDPAGRVNVSELATSLEGALLSEESKTCVLRQVALKLYKTEISALRTKVHHVSLERDTLKNSLNRTLEENKRLVKDGDEHADLVQKQSEQKLKEAEAHLTDRLHKEKRSREEDARQMQERAATLIKEMEKKVDLLRGEEEVLRQDLKLQQDECNLMTSELQKANRALDQKDRTIQMLQRDLGYRSELDVAEDGTHSSRVRELEDEVAERTELVNNLREVMTEMQDKYDLLVAENEKLKQKYLSQKRSMLRRSSPNDVTEVKKRHSTGDRPARPLSGSHLRRSHSNKPRLPPISYKLDLATEGSHHQILWEEDGFHVNIDKSGSSDEMEEEESAKQDKEEGVSKPISEESTPDEEDDDIFARSTTSLMHELQVEEEKISLKKSTTIEEPRKENAHLVLNKELLDQQLMSMDEVSQKDELHHMLEEYKQKQQELEKYISRLEKRIQDLSASQMEDISKLTTAEETVAKQELEIDELKTFQSNSDHKTSALNDELDQSKSLLEKEKSAHAEDVAFLKQQLTNLEVCVDSQTEQCLKLEEEKARAEEDVATLKQQMNSQSKFHESQVNSLMQKLEDLGKSSAILEAKNETQLKQLETELSNAYKKVNEFKEKSVTLEVQLTAALQRTSEVNKQELVVTKEDSTLEKCTGLSSSSEQSHVEALKVSMEKLETDNARMSLLNDQLKKENIDMCAIEKRMHTEILDLQNQLSTTEKELNDQSAVYMNEISRVKDDMEREKELISERMTTQLAEIHASLMKQMEESATTYELKLETAKRELKDSEDRVNSLKDQVVESQAQHEKLLATVNDLTESEAKWKKHVADLEYSQSKDVSKLKNDIQKYQKELSHMQMNETRFNETISGLENELKRRANFEDVDTALPTCSPVRSPYKSDSEVQGKLITQMKCRLEQLQRLLMKSRQHEDGETPNADIDLVQELLANHSALDSAMKRMRRDFETKNHELSHLKQLQSEVCKEQKSLEALTTSNIQQLLGRMEAFHGNSNKSLDKYRARIEAAAATLESVSASVQSQDRRHANALESVLSDLDQSQSEVCNYKEEVERLRAQLDQSNQYDDTDQVKQATDDVTIHRVATGSLEISPSPGSSKRRVDEGSGQVIDSSSEMDSAQSMENLLQQKYQEIKTLRDEVDHAKKMEKRTRATVEELEKELFERKCELIQITDEGQQKDKEIQKLQQKLSMVVNEPIEAVVKYVEKQPLESMNEAILTGMTHAVEEDRLKIKKQEGKIKKLQADLDSSIDEAKEISELREALESAERNMMESRQEIKELRIENETKLKDLVMKHAAELSATQSEIESNALEVKGLYHCLFDEDDYTSNEEKVDDLTHSQFVAESRKKIESLKEQLKCEQFRSCDLESTLLCKMKEHDQLDAQFQAEHEEEVRALRQQKQQLVRQIDEIKSHYQQLINEQEKQNSMLLQGLENSKANIEKCLKEKTEETYQVYQQVADLMEEKKVLMDIVHQLCVEAGRQIDVV